MGSHKLLVEKAEENIYKYIIDNNIAEGQKLPNEYEFGKMFDVGRSTVREAVKLLISKGVLEIRRGSGTFLVNKNPSVNDPFGLSGLEDKSALALDIADLRMILEPGMAEMAALNATEEDVEKLAGLCGSIENRIRNNDNYADEDIAFHTCIAECSKNKIAEQLIPVIDTNVIMFANTARKEFPEEAISARWAIVDAIRERDTIGARAAMTAHMTYNRKIIREIIENNSEEVL